MSFFSCSAFFSIDSSLSLFSSLPSSVAKAFLDPKLIEAPKIVSYAKMKFLTFKNLAYNLYDINYKIYF